jgi:acyl-CoA synthetase (AMP-forming)/AMP-acid ligase II
MTLQEATEALLAPGSMFEMDTAVIRGENYRVWKHAPQSLRTVLDLSLNHANKDFLVYEDERYTFERHYRTVATLAARLLELGVSPGDRVAVAARNLPEWVSTFWAAVTSGAVAVPLNAWWTG